MTSVALDPRNSATPVASSGAGFVDASLAVAGRTIHKFVRTPQMVVASTASGAMFLLIFRYVFGGAIGHTGTLSYVDFVIPGFVTTSVLFSGMGASAGIASPKTWNPACTTASGASLSRGCRSSPEEFSPIPRS